MVIKREDLEAAGTIVGEEMARHDLDSESWDAWKEKQGGGKSRDRAEARGRSANRAAANDRNRDYEEQHGQRSPNQPEGGHGTGVQGKGQTSTVKAEPKARGMEENAHQHETTGSAKGGGHVSSQGWPSKADAEAQIAKMKGYDDRDHEVVQDGKWFKIKYGPEKPEPTAGGKLHGVETHTTTDGQRVGKTVMVRAKDKAEAVAKVKSAGHEADSAWEAPDQTGEKYKGLEHVGDDKAKPRGIEDPTGGYPLVEARKKQVREAERNAKK